MAFVAFDTLEAAQPNPNRPASDSARQVGRANAPLVAAGKGRCPRAPILSQRRPTPPPPQVFHGNGGYFPPHYAAPPAPTPRRTCRRTCLIRRRSRRRRRRRRRRLGPGGRRRGARQVRCDSPQALHTAEGLRIPGAKGMRGMYQKRNLRVRHALKSCCGTTLEALLDRTSPPLGSHPAPPPAHLAPSRAEPRGGAEPQGGEAGGESSVSVRACGARAAGPQDS
jgi:hypothetical protein